MKKTFTIAAVGVAVVGALMLGLSFQAPTKSTDIKISLATPQAYAATCFKKGEYVSGMNKICIYDCLGSEAAITISSVALCPLSINR